MYYIYKYRLFNISELLKVSVITINHIRLVLNNATLNLSLPIHNYL